MASNNIPILNRKRLKFAQFDKNGYCHTHGYRYTKGHLSTTCTKPGANHCKDATRNDIKGGSTKNKDWICSYYEDKGFWVPPDRS